MCPGLTDRERRPLFSADTREVERAGAFVALDAEAEVDGALQQVDLQEESVQPREGTETNRA